MTTTMEYFVGIDVSKGRLDVAVLGEKPITQVANTKKGIADFAQRMRQLNPKLIVVEATGGYEEALVLGLFEAGLPMALVSPHHDLGLQRPPAHFRADEHVERPPIRREQRSAHQAGVPLPQADATLMGIGVGVEHSPAQVAHVDVVSAVGGIPAGGQDAFHFFEILFVLVGTGDHCHGCLQDEQAKQYGHGIRPWPSK